MTSPLLVDVSVWQDDTIAPTAWERLAAACAPWHGVILKATEGTGGSAGWQVRSAAWFARHWPAVGAVERYGRDWFRTAYHYLLADGRGREQADHYLDTIKRAGGWDVGDLWPCVDVEEGSGNAARVAKHGRAIVEDTAAAFVERIRERLARPCVLYAGWWLASIGVRSRMGCELLWYASYTRTLARATYERIGWDVGSLWAWQYAGLGSDGKVSAELGGYPHTTPIGGLDISAVTLAGGLERMRFAELDAG